MWCPKKDSAGSEAFARRSERDRPPGNASGRPSALNRPKGKTPRPYGVVTRSAGTSREIVGAGYRMHRATEPMDPHSLRTRLLAAARAERITKAATCHNLRHSFATHLASAGVSDRTLRSGLLGAVWHAHEAGAAQGLAGHPPVPHPGPGRAPPCLRVRARAPRLPQLQPPALPALRVGRHARVGPQATGQSPAGAVLSGHLHGALGAAARDARQPAGHGAAHGV